MRGEPGAPCMPSTPPAAAAILPIALAEAVRDFRGLHGRMPGRPNVRLLERSSRGQASGRVQRPTPLRRERRPVGRQDAGSGRAEGAPGGLQSTERTCCTADPAGRGSRRRRGPGPRRAAVVAPERSTPRRTRGRAASRTDQPPRAPRRDLEVVARQSGEARWRPTREEVGMLRRSGERKHRARATRASARGDTGAVSTGRMEEVRRSPRHGKRTRCRRACARACERGFAGRRAILRRSDRRRASRALGTKDVQGRGVPEILLEIRPRAATTDAPSHPDLVSHLGARGHMEVLHSGQVRPRPPRLALRQPPRDPRRRGKGLLDGSSGAMEREPVERGTWSGAASLRAVLTEKERTQRVAADAPARRRGGGGGRRGSRADSAVRREGPGVALNDRLGLPYLAAKRGKLESLDVLTRERVPVGQ